MCIRYYYLGTKADKWRRGVSLEGPIGSCSVRNLHLCLKCQFLSLSPTHILSLLILKVQTQVSPLQVLFEILWYPTQASLMTLVKEFACQWRRCSSDPQVGKIPWRKKW